MSFDYLTLVGFAKSWGLFYLILIGIAVVAYTFWPGNRKRFEKAKYDILDDEP
jgi:cytochrome c oxidase cbb3-type subunit 4